MTPSGDDQMLRKSKAGIGTAGGLRMGGGPSDKKTPNKDGGPNR